MVDIKLLLGQFVHSESFEDLSVVPKGFIAVQQGKIIASGSYEREEEIFESLKVSAEDVDKVYLGESQFLVPGFIDCHIHAPQFPNIGLGLDMELLDWLDAYTFPLEARYSDEAFATHVYSRVIKRTLRSGTTTACYFGTNHRSGTFKLAQEAHTQGQRAFVGKVSANCNIPDYYKETTQESISENIQFVEQVKGLQNGLVQPVITPRFAITCDMPLMKALAELAKKEDLNIQTHISESVGEIEFTHSLFEKDSYAAVYDEAGLLTNKCVLAHGVHLTDAELTLIRSRGSSISHCPTSNTNLRSGLCDVQRIMSHGIDVGLGTDVSGGSSASIKTAMKDALDVSHHLNFIKKQDILGTGRVSDGEAEQNKNYTPMNYKNVLYLATLGGAKALAIDNKTGNFAPGKEFDALLVDVAGDPLDFDAVTNPVNVTPEKRLLELLQKFIYTGDDRNIRQVFVRGVQVV